MRRLVIVSCVIVLAGAMMLGPTAPGALGQPTGHLVVIMFENKSYSQVIGNAATNLAPLSYAPYINGTIVPEGELFTSYYAVAHPSLPNYLTVTSGDTAGCLVDTCSPGFDTQENLFHQMDQASISWKAYAESMPSACATADSGKYIAHHNPPVYYSDLGVSPGDGTCASNDVSTAITTDAASGSLPEFSWVTPNKFNDMHNDQKLPTGPCALKSPIPDEVCQGDLWLSTPILPGGLSRLNTILSDNGKNDVTVVLAWDEGVGAAGGGGQVPMIVVGPNIGANSQVSSSFNHYGLENAIADWFGLTELHPAVPSI